MTDPLGQSQVLSYLRLLSKKNISFDIVSFEKVELYEINKQKVNDFIQDTNICWHPLTYTKSPPILSTVMDISKGWKTIKKLYSFQNYDIVHCRGYISAILGRMCKKKYSSKFIFDMRGWWADEKRESGIWKNPIYAPIYYYFKYLEKRFFIESDKAISLTYIGKEEIIRNKLKSENDIYVIPTCVDFTIFKPFDINVKNSVRSKLNISDESIVLVYSGSMGGNYRTDVVFGIFKTLIRIKVDAILLLITLADSDYIKNEIIKYDVPEEKVKIVKSSFLDVYKYLMVGDIGLIFYDNSFSAIGRSPTKLGEYWASGIPFISSEKTGDLDSILKRYSEGGVLLKNFSEKEYEKVLVHLLNKKIDRDKLREYAVDYYDIIKGVEAYYKIYSDC